MKNERGCTMFEHKPTLPNPLHRPTFASLLQHPQDNSQTTPPFSPPAAPHDDYYYSSYSDRRTSTSSTASPVGDSSPYSTMSPYTKSPWLIPNSPITTPLYNSPSFAKHSLIGSLVRKEGHVYSLAAYGGLLYTGSDSKNIRVWKNMKEFSGFKSNSGLVKAIAISSKGLIFTGHQDGKIRIWKSSKKKPGVHKRVGSLPTTKDYLISSINPNNYVEVRRRIKVLRIKHFDAVSCLGLNEELGLLYSGSWDRTMKVWRLSDFKCLDSVHAHDDALNAIASGFDGMVFTGSADGTVKVWRRELVGSSTRHVMVQVLLEQDCAVTSLAVDHHSRVVYCGSSDGVVNVWECEKQFSHCGTLRGHSLAVLCLAATHIGSGGGGFVFSGGADKSIRVWRRDGAGVHYCMSVFTGHAGPIKCLTVEEREETEDSGREWRLYSGSLDKSVKVWRVMEHARDEDGNLSDWFARMDMARGGMGFSPLRAGGDLVMRGADVDTPLPWDGTRREVR